MVREEAIGGAVKHDERLHYGGFAQRVDRFVEQRRQHRLGRQRLMIFALERLHHVVHHVRIALCVIEIVVDLP